MESSFRIILIVFALIYVLYRYRRANKKVETKNNKKNNFVNLDGVEESIKELLNANYEHMGHIIISSKDDELYVQFAREECGLLLNCPKAGVWENKLLSAKKLLESLGYTDINKPDAKKEDYDALKLKEFILSGDDVTGIYANVGADSTEIRELTATLFKEMFGCTDFEHLRVELVLRNR